MWAGDPGGGYVVRTARLTLRPVRRSDLDALHRLWTHPDVRRYFWDGEKIPRARSEAAIAEAVGGFDRYGFGLWVAGDDGRLLGFCGLRHLQGGPEVEILYGVAPSRWGSGLATEMASAMLRFAFDTADLTRLLGMADAANTASRRVLEKAGMTFRGYALRDGRGEAWYSVRPEELRPGPSAGS